MKSLVSILITFAIIYIPVVWANTGDRIIVTVSFGCIFLWMLSMFIRTRIVFYPKYIEICNGFFPAKKIFYKDVRAIRLETSRYNRLILVISIFTRFTHLVPPSAVFYGEDGKVLGKIVDPKRRWKKQYDEVFTQMREKSSIAKIEVY